MPPSWTRGQHSMVPPPANYMSWQFGRTPLYTSPSPQTPSPQIPSPQTPSPQSTRFSSASPTPPVIGTNAFVTSDTPNSIPTNSIHANSVPVNNVPANSVPINGVRANSGAATPTTDTIIAMVSFKENTALPPINRTSLISPQAVVDKYPKLLKASKLPMLSKASLKASKLPMLSYGFFCNIKCPLLLIMTKLLSSYVAICMDVK